MATRHERREQRRKEHRKQQPQRRGRRGGLPGWVVPVVVAGLAVAAIFGLRAAGMFDPPVAPVTPVPAAQNLEKIGTQEPDHGNTHVDTGQRVTYPSHPPTSGTHWALPHAGWGVKDTPQDDERVVHNLEHGGIAINYKNLSPDDLSNLKTLVRRLNQGEFRKVLLRPYDRMDNGIVLTAWRYSHRIPRYDEGTIVQFVQGHYGQRGLAPEPLAN